MLKFLLIFKSVAVYLLFSGIVFADSEMSFEQEPQDDQGVKIEVNVGEAKRIKLQFNGLLQAWYVNHSEELDQFRMRRSELKLKGNVSEGIDFFVMVDPTKKDKLFSDFGLSLNHIPYIKLTAGQFKIPVSLEGIQSSGELETVERAYVSKTLGDKRDVGAKVEGECAPIKLKYIVGVFNGEGENADEKNDQKDVAGMLMWMPVKELNIVGSYYEGEQGIHSQAKRRYGAGVRFERGSILIKGEYLEGKDVDVEADGWYVLAAYRLDELGYEVLKPVQLVVRYEEWIPNRDKSDCLNVWTVGGNYFLDPKYSKLQLDGLLMDGQGSFEGGVGVTAGWEIKF